MTKLRSGALPIRRIQANALASSERRLLTWFCGRMPVWVTPDILTFCGMVGALGVFVGYAASANSAAWLWLAIAGYIIQWFGDSMDGSLARYRAIERPGYGYFLDHSCDSIAIVLILAGLGLSPYVRLDVALFSVIGYFLLSIHTYLSARVINEFRLSYGAFGPTELRLLLVTLTLTMFFLGPEPRLFNIISGFDLFIGFSSALLIIIFLYQTFIIAQHLASPGLEVPQMDSSEARQLLK